MITRRCPQCYRFLAWPVLFIGRLGKPISWCVSCQDRYKQRTAVGKKEWSKLRRAPMPRAPANRAHLVALSRSAKLGPIPSSITSRGSCPPSCAFYNAGCYAEYHMVAMHWRKVGAGELGGTWAAFCREVAALPVGQLWRHNVAGDLPGPGERIDPRALEKLLRANDGKRGFSFSHKPVGRSGATPAANAQLIADANRRGFTVNLSANNLAHADQLAALAIGPVAVVLPANAPARATRTPAGRKVVVCPAQTHKLTCAECQLCAVATRKSIVGFRAHGQSAALVSELVQLRKRKERIAC